MQTAKPTTPPQPEHLSAPPPPAEPSVAGTSAWKAKGLDFRHLMEPLEQAAARFGTKVALRLRKNGELRTMTWSELVERIRAGAAALKAAGLRPGDRVILHSENSPDWIVGYYSVSVAGGTVVPLDANLSLADLSVLLKAADARLVIVSRAQAPKHLDSGCTAPQLVLEDRLSVASPSVPALPPTPVDADADPELASIIFTSGTSGRPKGVMLTHANLLYAGIDCVNPHFGLTEADELLLVLPLHHIFAFIIQCGALAAGATVTMVEAVRGDLLLAAMQETHTTILPGVPRLFDLFHGNIQRQVAQKGAATRAIFSTMRLATGVIRQHTPFNPGPTLFKPVFKQFGGARLRMVTAGGPASRELLTGMESLGFSIIEAYGMTESAAAATGATFPERRPGVAGRALAGSEVEIFQPNAAGEGEIRVRGRGLMRGYFREPELTAQVLRDGWYHTGDLGRKDSTGFFKIMGRLDELIVTPAGKKASPDDVERHYKGIEGVKELAVVGMPCGDRPGEEIHAAVVLDKAAVPNLDEQQLRHRVETEVAGRAPEIASYLRIQRVHFIEEIPKTTKLSVRRKELRKLLQTEAAPEKVDAPAVVEQRDALEERVVALVSQYVPANARRAPLTLRSSLQFDLGIDSLGRTELAASIAGEFGVPMEELGPSIHRISDLVAAVRKAQSDAQSPKAGTPDGAMEKVPAPRGVLAKIAVESIFWSTRVVWRIDVEGLEHLPAKGAYLLCPNHLTNLDGIWLAAVLPRSHRLQICSFAKAELWKSFWGRLLAVLAGAIRVDRDADAQPAMRAGMEVLKSGRPLLVFPEGTRSHSGELAAFRRGAARMALAAGVPIVPVRMLGTYEVYGTHRRLPRFLPQRNLQRVRLQVVIGKPLLTTPDAKGEQMVAELELTERMRKAVTELGA